MTRRDWTTPDRTYLRKNYRRMTVEELAAVLDRTPASVKTMAQTLGVARPGRKGCVPWNKGISYTIKKYQPTQPHPIPRPTLGPWGLSW